jgi:hypothetical protein
MGAALYTPLVTTLHRGRRGRTRTQSTHAQTTLRTNAHTGRPVCLFRWWSLVCEEKATWCFVSCARSLALPTITIASQHPQASFIHHSRAARGRTRAPICSSRQTPPTRPAVASPADAHPATGRHAFSQHDALYTSQPRPADQPGRFAPGDGQDSHTGQGPGGSGRWTPAGMPWGPMGVVGGGCMASQPLRTRGCARTNRQGFAAAARTRAAGSCRLQAAAAAAAAGPTATHHTAGPPPATPPQVAGKPAPSGGDKTGLVHLSEEARARATDKKANKFEKVRCGVKESCWASSCSLARHHTRQLPPGCGPGAPAPHQATTTPCQPHPPPRTHTHVHTHTRTHTHTHTHTRARAGQGGEVRQRDVDRGARARRAAARGQDQLGGAQHGRR